MRFITPIKTDRVTVIKNYIDGATGPGKVHFYTGGPSPSPSTPPSGTRLATVVLKDPVGSVVNGTLTFDLPDEVLVEAQGVIGMALLTDGDGNIVGDLTVSDLAGTGEVKLPTLQVYVGGILRPDSMVITEA